MVMMLLRRALAAPLQALIAFDDYMHPAPPKAPPAALRLPRTEVRGKRSRRSG